MSDWVNNAKTCIEKDGECLNCPLHKKGCGFKKYANFEPDAVSAVIEFINSEYSQLRAELEAERQRVAMLQEVIKNIGGALDANQKSWFEMEAANAELRAAMEEIIARCELHILDDDIHADNYYEAKAALASPVSELLAELRRLRTAVANAYVAACYEDWPNVKNIIAEADRPEYHEAKERDLLEKALDEVGNILKEACSEPVCVANITMDDNFQCKRECYVNDARMIIRKAKAGD